MTREPGLPLTTGEGNTAREKLRYLATGDGDFRPLTSDDAKALLAECGRLRKRDEDWQELQRLMRVREFRLREELETVRESAEMAAEAGALWNERTDRAEAQVRVLSTGLQAVIALGHEPSCSIARAALGVEGPAAEVCECGHTALDHVMFSQQQRCARNVETDAPLGGGRIYSCPCRQFIAVGVEGPAENTKGRPEGRPL